LDYTRECNGRVQDSCETRFLQLANRNTTSVHQRCEIVNLEIFIEQLLQYCAQAVILLSYDMELYIPNGESHEKAFGRVTHLCVAAHQDDVEIMAYHGIAECYEQKNKGFGAIVVSDGGGSPRNGAYKNYTDAQMIEVRKQEQKTAADLGKYSLLGLLMFPSREIKDKTNDKVVNEIYKLLMQTRPEIVYTHNLADKHDTHVAVAMKTIMAIRKMPKTARPQKLLGCEVWRGLDWLCDEDKVVLDTGKNPELGKKLIGVFESQNNGGKRYDLATHARWVANATFHQSHSVDEFTHASYAMDLTPLVKDDKIDITAFMDSHLTKFADTVKIKYELF